jgi:hypothetical protein
MLNKLNILMDKNIPLSNEELIFELSKNSIYEVFENIAETPARDRRVIKRIVKDISNDVPLSNSTVKIFNLNEEKNPLPQIKPDFFYNYYGFTNFTIRGDYKNIKEVKLIYNCNCINVINPKLQGKILPLFPLYNNVIYSIFNDLQIHIIFSGTVTIEYDVVEVFNDEIKEGQFIPFTQYNCNSYSDSSYSNSIYLRGAGPTSEILVRSLNKLHDISLEFVDIPKYVYGASITYQNILEFPKEHVVQDDGYNEYKYKFGKPINFSKFRIMLKYNCEEEFNHIVTTILNKNLLRYKDGCYGTFFSYG